MLDALLHFWVLLHGMDAGVESDLRRMCVMTKVEATNRK